MTEPEPARPDFGAPRMRLSVGRGPLTTPVLVRSIGAFASRTSLPVDRINDIADILEAMAASLPGDRITLTARVEREGEGLQLSACGLEHGTARSLLSDVRHGGLARLLAVAADGVAVRSSSREGESLVVTFAPPR